MEISIQAIIADAVSAAGTTDVASAAEYAILSVVVFAALVGFVCGGIWIYKLVRMQLQLKYSITLVQLKSPKLFLFVADAILAVLMIFSLSEVFAPGEQILSIFSLNETLIRLALGAAFAICFVALGITLTLTFCKSAVVDRGVFIGAQFLDWYHLYDYYIDEATAKLILSNNPDGPLTLKGTTMPLRYNKNDSEKLKFILNKNRNKFVPRYELR